MTSFLQPASAHTLLALGSSFFLLALTTTSTAADFRSREPKPRVVEDLFRLEVSVVGASYDTVVRLDDDNSTIRNTTINIEDDLGLDDMRALIQGEITFLPGERHLLRLSGQSTRRSASRQLQRTITIEDDTFVLNARVASKLDLTLFGLTYGYRFLKRERFELDGTFSIQFAEADANITGRDAAGNQIRGPQDAEDGVAPIPLLGLEGRYDFGSRWSAEGRIQYVGANTEGVDAAISDARIAITWRQNPHLVYGIGYRRFAIDVDVDRDDDSGRLDLKISGPTLFLRGSL